MKDLSNENVQHINNNSIQYLQFRKLMKYNNIVKHAYGFGTNISFGIEGLEKGKISKPQYDEALKNYNNLCNAINVNYKNIVETRQKHTDNVKIIKQKILNNNPDFNLPEYENTDGLITAKEGITLATINADCILMLFFDPEKRVIANIHSGWRGTVKRISVKTIEKMQKEYNCNPKDIICCICPSIRKCHFEVDKDVSEIFYNEFNNLPNIEQMIERNDIKNKWNIDTVKINQTILEQKGLKSENIIDSGICSVCNKELIHSYRVEKENYGVSTAIIEITKQIS